MSQGIDIDFVRATYQRMSDQELTAQLTQHAAGLTPEAMELVKDEIKKRGLHPNLASSVDIQQKESFTIEEIDQYCELLRALPCPVTDSTENKLNATLTATARSYVFMTHYNTKIVIGSPEALRNAHNKAMLISALTGWWGIPWGPIRTLTAVFVNLRNKKTTYRDLPIDHFRTFVLANIGEIEAHRDDKAMLKRIIAR
jgi:hypothetical protein